MTRMDDLTLPLEAKPRISAEEQTRRKAAIDYARGSVRLEGFTLDAATEALYRAYIGGHLTRAELNAAILDDHCP